MTLLELERLARKISEALEAPDTYVAPMLAEAYAANCHSTNLRLQQCESMLRAGDRHQAIQLAETAPNLLDAVTALEFRKADDFRAFCVKHGLPVADRIDGRAVQALNECYAQGISTDHPLYAAYRKATLARNDSEALKTLQSITRLNPTDGNATSELTRLDAKLLQARLDHLRDLLEAGSPEIIVAAVEAIEAFGFQSIPNGETWRKAQEIRCEALLRKAESFRAAGNWSDCLATVELIQRLETDHTLEFGGRTKERVSMVGGWAAGEQKKDTRERDFRRMVTQLEHMIRVSEEKDTAARDVPLGEMKQDYEDLHKVWRTLADFTRSIPEEAAASFRKRTALLEVEIVRRTALRRRALVGAAALGILIAVVAGWRGLLFFQNRDLRHGISQGIAERKVRAVEKLLSSAQDKARLGAFAAQAETFLAKEKGLLQTYEESFNKLPKTFPEDRSAAGMTAVFHQLATARTNLDALAPDLKAELEPGFGAFARKWESFLADTGRSISGSMRTWLTAAEEEASKLDYRASPEQARQQLEVVSNKLAAINQSLTGFTNILTLGSDLVQRTSALNTKFAAHNEELAKVTQGMEQLRNARTFAEYTNGLNVAGSSEFSQAPAVKAAAAVKPVVDNEEGQLRSLLNITNLAVWAALRPNQTRLFVPAEVFPAEAAILKELNEDPAVSGTHQRVRLWLDSSGANALEWIVSGAFSESTGWNTIKAYEPTKFPGRCVFVDRTYGYFDGGFRLSPTQAIHRIQMAPSQTANAAYENVGLRGFSGGYGKSLLEALDALKNSSAGSALFRGYVFLRLVEVMRLRPEAWGLPFAPSILEHEQAIRAAAGGSLSSGDWFVVERLAACEQKLDQVFTSTKRISYTEQASGFLALGREARKAGLRYVGYVDLDGKAILLATSKENEVWTCLGNGRQPRLLATSLQSGSVLSNSMPLSPLLSLGVRRHELLKLAGVDPQSPSFNGYLPPMFTDLKEPTP